MRADVRAASRVSKRYRKRYFLLAGEVGSVRQDAAANEDLFGLPDKLNVHFRLHYCEEETSQLTNLSQSRTQRTQPWLEMRLLLLLPSALLLLLPPSTLPLLLLPLMVN